MQIRYHYFVLCLFVSLVIPAQQWDWAKTFNGPAQRSREVGTAVAPTGDIYIAFSYIDVNYGKPFGGMIVKFDPQGTELWRKTFSQPFTIHSIICDPNGNLAVCGLFTDTLPQQLGGLISSGGNDGFFTLLDPNFSPIWSQKFSGNANEEFADVTLDNQNNFLLTGSFEKNCSLGNYTLATQGLGATFVARYNFLGQVVQAFATDSPDSVSANGGQKIVCDGYGRIHVMGGFMYRMLLDTMVRNSQGYYGMSQFIAGFSPGGQALYLTKAIDATSYFHSISIMDSVICLTGDGGWTTGGWQMTHAFTHDGAPLWQKTHGGFYFDYSGNSVAGQDGKFFSVGQVTDPNVPQWVSTYSLCIRQFDKLGQENIFSFPSSGGGDFRKICPLGNNEFLLVGYTPVSVNFGNYLLQYSSGDMFLAKIKFTVNPTGLAQSSQDDDLQIYPNPASGNINLKYPEGFSDASVIIYDAMGKQVQEHHRAPLQIPTGNLSSGIYFVVIRHDKNSVTQKLIKE